MTRATRAISAETRFAANARAFVAAVKNPAARIASHRATHVKKATVVVVLKPAKAVTDACANTASYSMKGVPVAMKKMLENKNQSKPARRPSVLRFSPTAWAKLLFLRD